MKEDRKPYQKPTLEKLVLVPRETVLADCQDGTGTNSSAWLPLCEQATTLCYNPTKLQGPSLGTFAP